jgi:hypothetical protein
VRWGRGVATRACMKRSDSCKRSSCLLALCHAHSLLLIVKATFFGTDAWSIHEGGCNYGYIWQDQGPVGWDTAGGCAPHAQPALGTRVHPHGSSTCMADARCCC